VLPRCYPGLSRKWSGRPDSNQRSPAPEAALGARSCQQHHRREPQKGHSSPNTGLRINRGWFRQVLRNIAVSKWRPQRDTRRVGVLGLFKTRRTPINQVNLGLASSRGRFRCTSIDPVIPPEREKSRDDRSRKVPGLTASSPVDARPGKRRERPAPAPRTSTVTRSPLLVLAVHRSRVAIPRRRVQSLPARQGRANGLIAWQEGFGLGVIGGAARVNDAHPHARKRFPLGLLLPVVNQSNWRPSIGWP
jgi:hypothetical protein